MRVYLRRSMRPEVFVTSDGPIGIGIDYITGSDRITTRRLIRTIDVSSVDIWDEKQRGRGLFRSLLGWIENMADGLEAQVYVESIVNARLLEAFCAGRFPGYHAIPCVEDSFMRPHQITKQSAVVSELLLE